ncbi:MAG: hypothetical protein ABII18_11580 [bacterium]|nr:hypothetical protein [bacterium]MBU1919067.1 hypothetical protein [bacterium]
MRNFQTLTFFLVLISLCAACQPTTNIEKTFLDHFKVEKVLLTSFQEDYVAYMAYQLNHFTKKQQELTKLITAINRQFNSMSPSQQTEYEKKWQKEFQPVIDDIYRLTKSMILTQKETLTLKEKTEIQTISLKMGILEKKTNKAKLLPRFFYTPEEK